MAAKKGDKAPSVAIIFGSGENFMLATETSYLGDLAKTVGATNIASNLEGDIENGYVQLSLEHILKENPDYIVRITGSDEIGKKKIKQLESDK